jgi:glycosyltransferase involved in cell wall biosynthesis
VVETHPVQYHAPVYRAVQRLGVPVTVVYGSDFSVAGYQDREFGARFAWDTDLLAGYEARFLSRVTLGGAGTYADTRATGLGRMLADLRPAAVLLLGYGSRFDKEAIRAAFRARYPILFRGETTDHALCRSWVKNKLRDQLLRCLYGRCRRLLYVGQRSRAHYRRLGVPADRLVFSPYCVDTAPFRTEESDRAEIRGPTRQQLGVSPDQLLILYSGKLVARKGVDLLPSAVRRLPTSVAGRVVVALLGDGELRGALAGAPAFLGRFLGFQNQTRLSPFYHAADLFVLPSRAQETWGLVVNEALHHGLPCVVSDQVGSAPDLIKPGETGEVFRSDDVEDLAGALTRAVSLVGRPAVRDRCRAIVTEYSVDAAAAGVVAAFRAVTAA